jgi:glutamyl-tRNA synthetase
VAEAMLAAGAAYKCFSTQEEIEAFREAAKAEGARPCSVALARRRARPTHPDAPFVIRLKAPREGATVIEDAVQGT